MVEIDTTFLKQVDGSASWTQNVTKVVCSVSGPMEAKIRDEIPTAATLELVVRPIVGLTSTREVLLQDRLYSVISSVILRHLNPRSLVQIVLQVLETGESTRFTALELAACINSCIIALVDAGIPLQGIAVATVAAIVDGKAVFNPSKEQLEKSTSQHVVAYEVKENTVQRLLLAESLGQFKESDLLDVLEKGVTECQELNKEIRASLTDKVKRDFIWKN
ncbi:exosome complex component Rrp46p [Trichomonascus vanleenenianus]|uniref:exosome non-catalytic core subunit RRP46 n=1 Tax=Trichomonascus vanleenenianus TaxID=2268995 RepID=UPI003ECB3613